MAFSLKTALHESYTHVLRNTLQMRLNCSRFTLLHVQNASQKISTKKSFE